MAVIRHHQRASKAPLPARRRIGCVAGAVRRRRHVVSRRIQIRRSRRAPKKVAATTDFVVHRDTAEVVEDLEGEDNDAWASDHSESDKENVEPVDENAAPPLVAIDLVALRSNLSHALTSPATRRALGDITALFHAVSLDDARDDENTRGDGSGASKNEGAAAGDGGYASDEEEGDAAYDGDVEEVADDEERLRALAKEWDARPYGHDGAEREQATEGSDHEFSSEEDSSDEEEG